MSVVVSDMYSVILDAGVQAAISAGTSGPAFNITGFQLGSSSAAEGATAVSTATGVDNPVYTGLASQIYYALLPDSDACLFRIVLDESVGNFAVGQICLMLSNTAFSKSVLFQQQNKWQSNLPSVYGNNISFDLVLAISDAQSCINLTTLQSLYAMLPEVTDETQLPAAGSTLYNTYIVRNHTELGIPAMAVARNSTWNFTPCRLQAGQGESVIAVPPAMFDVSVQVNMAVYFNYTSGTYLPADPTDQNKFPVGIRTSLSEVTQTGYVSRYMAGTSSDIWPSNLTLNTMYSVQVGTPGVPGLNATYQAYGIAISNNLMYVDLAHSLGASWLDQEATITGVQPMDKSHQHSAVTEAVNGFMLAADKAKLDNPASFISGENGITILTLAGGNIAVCSDAVQGVVITPDAIAAGLYPGAPVCLQMVSGARTWVAADPSVPALRPIGILSTDSDHVITTGNVVVSITVPVPPAPGNLPTLSLTSDNPATIVNGVETPVSASTSTVTQTATTIGVGTVIYAGEGANAGTLQLSGNWVVGIALDATTVCVDFDAIASIADHTNALTATSPIANKNASPAGVKSMLANYLPLAGGTMTGAIVADGIVGGTRALNAATYTTTVNDLGRILEIVSPNAVAITCLALASWTGGEFTVYNASPKVASITVPTGSFYGPSGNLLGTLPIPVGAYMTFFNDGANVVVGQYQPPAAAATLVFPPQTTFYVNSTTGSDTTGDGLTATTAWATIQHTIDTISRLHVYYGTITIQVADGTYTALANQPCAMFYYSAISDWALIGNPSNPSNCIINATALGCRGLLTQNGASVTVNGFQIVSYYEGIASSTKSYMAIENVNISPPSSSAVPACGCYAGSTMQISGNINISSGGYINVFTAAQGSYMYFGYQDVNGNLPVTITVSGNPNFSVGFVQAQQSAAVMVYTGVTTITGAGTGYRFAATSNGTISTNGAGINYFPGNTAGYCGSGGQYL